MRLVHMDLNCPMMEPSELGNKHAETTRRVVSTLFLLFFIWIIPWIWFGMTTH